ncbi:hypothetical protein APHAL10511_008148 [Amanita phalloides]|nr:hypothetical protein APHAL10511_008148 [Amanita phalloides]
MADTDALYAELRRRMIETGEWDRIASTLSSKLNEQGWLDNLMDYAKERARGMPDLTFQSLYDDVLVFAHKSLPVQIEKETKTLLRHHLEQQFE